MNQYLLTALLTTSILIAPQSRASSPSAYAVLDRQSAAACTKSAGLRNSTVGPPVRFSDTFLIDARLVTGTWPQPHMHSAKGTMLCLYNRRSKRAETQEMTSTAPAAPPASAERAAPAAPAQNDISAPGQLKDVWWRARDIAGSAIIEGSDVLLMLGSDGMIGGKSGCNNYALRYMITGTTLQIYPPLTGTGLQCAPALMQQEVRFQQILQKATLVNVQAGALVVTTPDGQSLLFVRAASEAITTTRRDESTGHLRVSERALW